MFFMLSLYANRRSENGRRWALLPQPHLTPLRKLAHGLKSFLNPNGEHWARKARAVPAADL